MFFLIGCSGQESPSENSNALEGKEQALEEFLNRLNEAAQAGDKTVYKNLFLPDASMFLPNRPPLEGRDAIGDWFEKYRNTITQITDTYVQEKIDIVGDVALVRSRGTGDYVINATQERIPLRNKFVDILKYTVGEWLMVYHLASSFSYEPGLWDRDW